MHPDLSICIISHNGYGAISGHQEGYIGGVEWQTSMLARWMAAHGHKVSFLTWDESGPDEEILDGVRVIKICSKKAGIPGIRFFHPRWSRLLAALRKADAKVYYHNCAECVTGQIALWCRVHDRMFVFTAASETDCDARLPVLKHWKDRMLYRAGLRYANRVIVQTNTQKEMMRQSFSVDAVIIPMPCQRATQAFERVRMKPASTRVLWVARVCPNKRPDLLVEVARMSPEFHFDLVGPHSPDTSTFEVVRAATALPNVTVHGRLSRETVAKRYGSAACLISTSDFEGFPNTFLEAWSHALPIVSRFDPDGLIASKQLGLIGSDAASLAQALKRLLGSEELYKKCSENALRYFLENHAMEQVQPRFERILLEAANPKRKK